MNAQIAVVVLEKLDPQIYEHSSPIKSGMTVEFLLL